MERPPDQDEEPGADLLSIGLFVFFVSVIAVVAALLILPAIF